MSKEDIELKVLPEMNEALLIACFDGWGNALEVSSGMADYLIRKLEAEPFGSLNADPFYIFKEKRPVVEVEQGALVDLKLPGCDFYAVGRDRVGRDLVILKGAEPDLQWFRFTGSILSLCRRIGVKTIVSCGGMLDNILHTDTMISVVASSLELLDSFRDRKASVIDYNGPSSIHSTLHAEAKKGGFDCAGLYCHCPYYLQGVTHFGLLAYLGTFLSGWAGFELDTAELSILWKEVRNQIEEAVDKNSEIKKIVDTLKKGRRARGPETGKKGDKVVKLEDYLRI